MKMLGKEVAGSCIWVEKGDGTGSGGGDDGGVEVQAFLVKAGIGTVFWLMEVILI